jgi:hypothetical protein
LARFAKQGTGIEKEISDDLGDREHVLAVRNRVKNRFFEMVAEPDHPLGMAGWTKPSSSTRKRHNVLVMAISPLYRREAFVEITAFEVFPDDL